MVCPGVVHAARAINDERSRTRVLGTLAPHMPIVERSPIYQAALNAVRTSGLAIALVEVLGSLAPHLPKELLPDALNAALAITFNGTRPKALGTLAPSLAAHRLPAQVWLPTLRSLATHGRSGLLSSLVALTPWLVTLTTPEDRASIAHAIIVVCRCWP